MAQFALMSLEDLRSRGADELAQLFKASEQEKLRLTAEHSRSAKDLNRTIQTHVMEIRCLREQNQKLLSENEELRDLCCYLDGGRQKEQRTVEEWQKFGRYTTDLMQNDVKMYRGKLGSLEIKVDMLMKENLELKELCVLLAEDKGGLLLLSGSDSLLDRVAGDGSSSSSPPNEKVPVRGSTVRNNATDDRLVTFNDEAVRYLRHLEARVSQLVMENDRLVQQQNSIDDRDYRKFVVTAEPAPTGQKTGPVCPKPHRMTDHPLDYVPTADDGIRAMKVLNVHDQVHSSSSQSRESNDDVMDESEKEIVRQMCKVVWRKLGSTAPGYKTAV